MTNAEETDQRSLDELKDDAKADGRRKGKAAVENCEIKETNLYNRWAATGDQRVLRDVLMEQAHLAEQNSRQYSGHPINEITRLDLENWEMGEVTRAYDEGVSEGIEDGLEERMEEEIAQYRESITPEQVREFIEETEGLEIHDTLDPRHLLGFFEDYEVTLDDMRYVVKVWRGEEMTASDHLYHQPTDRFEQALRALDEKLDYHGLETVRDGRGGKVLYHYANSGDTVLPELFWSPDMEAWVFGDMETLASLGDPRLFHKREVEV